MNLISMFLAFLMLHNAQPVNMLVFESSPYLQMHSHNIVKWRAWNEASLNEAKLKGKPIFLSIGFSTCHWCHVMEREVFNNPVIAALINKYFIPIKVDKEEMPNIDNYYMRLYEVMNERKGGWPLTFVLTEDLEPIFAGTYIPPFSTGKTEGLDKLIPELIDEYKNERAFIKEDFEEYKKEMSGFDVAVGRSNVQNDKFINNAITNLKMNYDEKFGGFKHLKIKFPAVDTLKLLIELSEINKNEDLLNMVKYSANMMMKSGLYDQVEGAFFRYSTLHNWKIPHFEKMLYTNAMLIDLYSELYAHTKNNAYKRIVEDTISEINKLYRDDDNLYFSASDAESEINNERVEGGYFIYKYDDTYKYLISNGFDKKTASDFLKSIDISKQGNFHEGYSVPNIYNLKIKDEKFLKGISLLKKMRKNRKFPFIDKKKITSWNALMSAALIKAGDINKVYKKEGIDTLNAILSNFEQNGKLKHIKINLEIKIDGMLEDYSYLISALITAYQSEFDEFYLKKADILTKKAISEFYKNGIWYSSLKGFKSIENLSDRYLTSPATLMVNNLFILSLMKENKKYFDIGQESLNYLRGFGQKSAVLYPSSVSLMLQNKIGSVLLKSNKENLYKIKNLINRPFVYYKDINNSLYIGCSENICFTSGENANKIAKDVENFRAN